LALNQMIYSNEAYSQSKIITVLSTPEANLQQFIHTKCQVELVVLPSEEIMQFVIEK
jgi:hypothetical protein